MWCLWKWWLRSLRVYSLISEIVFCQYTGTFMNIHITLYLHSCQSRKMVLVVVVSLAELAEFLLFTFFVRLIFSDLLQLTLAEETGLRAFWSLLWFLSCFRGALREQRLGCCSASSPVLTLAQWSSVLAHRHSRFLSCIKTMWMWPPVLGFYIHVYTQLPLSLIKN